MKAVKYYGPGDKRVKDVPEPAIQEPTDAIVRVRTTTICGTDLHILKGHVTGVKPGTVLGHEAVAVVGEVGAGVRRFRPGDRVIVPAISACGICSYCRRQMYGQCENGGGWIFGHLIDGLYFANAAETRACKVVLKVGILLVLDARVRVAPVQPPSLLARR